MITVIAIASGLYMRYFIIEAIKGVQSKNWPQAHGTIIKSLVAERSGGDLESYAPEISYDFEALGEKYLGSNLAFLNNYSSNSIENVEELISEYPIGRRVTIYYNPEEPSVCVC